MNDQNSNESSSDEDLHMNETENVDSKKHYKKEWYKKNAERIKKCYDPAKRREKYQKEKEVKAKIKEKFDNAESFPDV